MRKPTSGGRGPTKLLFEKSRAYDKDDKLKISLGNGPVNLLLSKVAIVSSCSLPRLVGSGPSNLFSPA